VTKTRLEAFSDGVFAVAITLLALDLAVVPAPIHSRISSATSGSRTSPTS
jgi:uncharacterized membrane protein